MKGVMNFGKKGKKVGGLWVHKILNRIGKVDYELELPTNLAFMHLVFYFSLLKKCVSNTSHALPLENVGV